MARSSVGGTRSKLRGVVGDVIYQIARNPYGNYEQKIITYTREKLNRNTRQQALARMQIAMFQRCMSMLTPVIQCSFQGVKTGVTSINQFVSYNMKLVQEYCIDHWKYGGGFSFPIKGKEYESFGEFIISTGSYQPPKQFSWDYGKRPEYIPILKFSLAGTPHRLYDLRKMLRFSYSDSLNVLVWNGQPDSSQFGLTLVNMQLNRQFGDYTRITQANVDKVFAVSPTFIQFTTSQAKQVQMNAYLDESSQTLSIAPNVYVRGLYEWIPLPVALFSFIFSHKKGNVWERNTNRLFVPKPLDPDDPWGRQPYEAFYSWCDEYDGEDYEDFFK